jgi:hypothetical protein
MADPPNIWQRAWIRLQPDVESWIVDTARFALLFLGLILFYGIFKILRSMGFNQTFVDILEDVDHAGAGIVFTIYVVSIIRRALASFSRYGK